MSEENFARFKKCAVEVLGVEEDKITKEASFADDLDADSLDGPPARLLEQLRREGYPVWLRLLQPLEATGDTPDWRRFLAAVRERYNDVATIEIGTTTNRRRWSGYTYASYAARIQSCLMP